MINVYFRDEGDSCGKMMNQYEQEIDLTKIYNYKDFLIK